MTIWVRCENCLQVSGFDVDAHDPYAVALVEPCEVCGSDEIVLADYLPEAQ